eukprot:ANDGO_04525.mRNA.1 Coiled-coil domain-containing protein 42 homolog
MQTSFRVPGKNAGSLSPEPVMDLNGTRIPRRSTVVVDEKAEKEKRDAAKVQERLLKYETEDVSTESTKLLQLRKALIRAGDEYDRAQESFEHQEREFTIKEAQLKQMEDDLQRQLSKFNRFLLDNDAKRARAEKKALDEARLVVEKQREIVALHKELENIEKARKSHAEEVSRLSAYAKFLLSFIEKVEGFNDINDVIERYHALRATEKALVQRRDALEAELEAMQREYNRKKYEAASVSARLGQQRSHKQQMHEELTDESLWAQREWDEESKRYVNRRLVSTEVQTAVEEMYLRCMKSSLSRGTHRPPAQSLMEKLQLIGEFVDDMQNIKKFGDDWQVDQ